MQINPCVLESFVDCPEAAWPEEEVEGDLCGRAWSRHGRANQGVVPSAHQTDISGGIWYNYRLHIITIVN